MREAAHVAVAVTDEGRGLAPELLPKLFTKHGGAGGTAAGYGLGLAICRGLVEAQSSVPGIAVKCAGIRTWSADADVGAERRNPVPYRDHRDVLRADAPPKAR